jgi:ATP-binding cassette subfamily G (WHITE) protein 2 (SNQ2)
MIPKPQLISEYIWFGWLYYVNPISYSFEAVMANEFSDRVLSCAPIEIVPNGPGYDNPAYQGCAFTGAQTGSLSIPGSTYLEVAFNYAHSHMWRNFGVSEF